MSYKVVFHPKAAKEFTSLDRQVQPRILSVIESLAEDPFRHGSIQLKGETARRIRVSDYRVIYEVDAESKVITIYKVRHRSEAYR
jgi:mRNA interferase RelE/StbE